MLKSSNLLSVNNLSQYETEKITEVLLDNGGRTIGPSTIDSERLNAMG